nr:MAG TPA: hypothetical protein [Caudoviricetes sp.]
MAHELRHISCHICSSNLSGFLKQIAVFTLDRQPGRQSIGSDGGLDVVLSDIVRLGNQRGVVQFRNGRSHVFRLHIQPLRFGKGSQFLLLRGELGGFLFSLQLFRFRLERLQLRHLRFQLGDTGVLFRKLFLRGRQLRFLLFLLLGGLFKRVILLPELFFVVHHFLFRQFQTGFRLRQLLYRFIHLIILLSFSDQLQCRRFWISRHGNNCHADQFVALRRVDDHYAALLRHDARHDLEGKGERAGFVHAQNGFTQLHAALGNPRLADQADAKLVAGLSKRKERADLLALEFAVIQHMGQLAGFAVSKSPGVRALGKAGVFFGVGYNVVHERLADRVAIAVGTGGEHPHQHRHVNVVGLRFGDHHLRGFKLYSVHFCSLLTDCPPGCWAWAACRSCSWQGLSCAQYRPFQGDPAFRWVHPRLSVCQSYPQGIPPAVHAFSAPAPDPYRSRVSAASCAWKRRPFPIMCGQSPGISDCRPDPLVER